MYKHLSCSSAFVETLYSYHCILCAFGTHGAEMSVAANKASDVIFKDEATTHFLPTLTHSPDCQHSQFPNMVWEGEGTAGWRQHGVITSNLCNKFTLLPRRYRAKGVSGFAPLSHIHRCIPTYLC